MKKIKSCKHCSRGFVTYHDGQFCSSKCYGIAQRGKPHPWRILKIYGYSAVHKWLKKEFGKPVCCETPNCPNKPRRFEYALRKGFKYERKRVNFITLCPPCHRKYDWTPEQTKKLSEIMKKRVFTSKIRKNMSLGQQGRILTTETRNKISEGQKRAWARGREVRK